MDTPHGRQFAGQFDARRSLSKQKQVEIFDFSTLALAPYPALLSLGPHPAAVKEEKPPARVAAIQSVNAIVN